MTETRNTGLCTGNSSRRDVPRLELLRPGDVRPPTNRHWHGEGLSNISTDPTLLVHDAMARDTACVQSSAFSCTDTCAITRRHSSCRFITNRYLVTMSSQGQDVEWGYCFDVHLNAFFPLLMILHFFQLPFLNGKDRVVPALPGIYGLSELYPVPRRKEMYF